MAFDFLKTPKPGLRLGADCSSNSFAFSVFDGEELLHWGDIRYGKGDIHDRMHRASKYVEPALRDFAITDIYFESAVYIQNKKTVITLAYMFGAALAPMLKPGVNVHPVSPIAWQNYIGNKPLTKLEKALIKGENPGKTASWYLNANRNFRKQRTMDWVNQKYNLEITNDDVGDALALGSVGHLL